MATVFMKWLERRPALYDRGIQLLTLGHLSQLQDRLVQGHIGAGQRVLELGCGTGVLTLAMAKQGAEVIAVDQAREMLDEAEARVRETDVSERVVLHQMDVRSLGDHYESDSFDRVVASLVLSELPPEDLDYVLMLCRELLSPQGEMIVLDEVLPERLWARVLMGIARAPLRIATWLLTRTTTHPLLGLQESFQRVGYESSKEAGAMFGTLGLFVAKPEPAKVPARLPASVLGALQPYKGVARFLLELWALFFRIVPPYPSRTPGLYTLGHPRPDDPVLVTGNFALTVHRFVKAVQGKLNAWVLVVDSRGINVWCAAGGGFLHADAIVGALRRSGVGSVVTHHALVLPQLCANGVDGWRIREETGWGVHWGPVRAEDLPAYLEAGRKKTDEMRWVRFPLASRLEMVTVTLGFYALLILIPVAVFWRHLLAPVGFSLLGLSYFYALVHPWLPGRDGLEKSVPLALLAIAGAVAYSLILAPTSSQGLFNRILGVTALSVFVGAELQGMSPLMRGEQANWGWEAFVGLLLGALYWLVPLAVGWG
jgi:ubiquinone/menaquinone biosynthesis C-methylase UbiE